MEYEANVSRTHSASASLGLFLLRLIPFALLIIFHGWEKLMGAYSYLFEGQQWMFIGATEKLGFPYPEYFAVAAALAESLFCVLVIVGLLTRFSAAVIAFNFLVATYSHVITDFKIESAAMYLAPALALVFTGAGGFSLDALIRRRPETMKHRHETTVHDPDTGRTRRVVVHEHAEEAPHKPERPL